MTGPLDQDLTVAIEALVAKQAEGLVALDVRALCGFTDTLVICHGNATRHVEAMAAAVRDEMRTHGRRPHHIEGMGRGEWVLMDYLDLVLHIFLAERRRFYALEHLWGDAPKLDLQHLTGAPAPTAGGSTA